MTEIPEFRRLIDRDRLGPDHWIGQDRARNWPILLLSLQEYNERIMYLVQFVRI